MKAVSTSTAPTKEDKPQFESKGPSPKDKVAPQESIEATPSKTSSQKDERTPSKSHSSKKLSSSGHDLVATIEHIIEPTLDPEMILGRSLCSTKVFTTPT